MARSTFEQAGEDLAFESIIQAGTLDTWLDHVGMFVQEFRLHITPDGYHTKVVDPANVAMTYTSLDKTAFESHRAGHDGDGSLVVGMAIDRLQDVLGLVGNGDLVSIGFDDETRMLHLRTGEISQSIALIDPDTIRKEPDTPEIDLPTEVEIPASSFSRAINASALVSDHILIGYYDDESEHRQEGLYFSAEGDTDDSLIEPDETDQDVHRYGKTESLFSGNYMSDIESVLPKNGPVTVQAGMEFPAIFDFAVGDDHEEEIIETTVMLAPRIQTE